MVLKDYIVVAIAGISLIVSLFAIRVSKEQATSDFRAQQAVKEDTAMLLAALRALAYKGAVYSQQPEFVDISAEKRKIQEFLTSTTAVAYHGHLSRKSKQAYKEGRSEEWRAFLLEIIYLLKEDNPLLAAKKAVSIEETFFNFSAKEFDAILTELSDLSQAIANGNEIRESDTILKALSEKDSASLSDEAFQPFMRFLKEEKSVKDPDVDFLFAVLENDRTLLESALDSGADRNTTPAMIIQKYENYWKEFNNQNQ